MKIVSTALAVLLAVPALAQPCGEDTRIQDLERRIASLSTRANGVVGVHVLHLETGCAASRNAGQRFPMASTYKVPIAIAVLRRVDQGKLKLAQWVPVERTDLRRGGGEVVLKMWKPGLSLTVQDLLEHMMTESDNTATDVLFGLLGGPGAVKATLAELGVSGIDVSRTELQLGADVSGVTLPDRATTLEEFGRLRQAVPAAARKAAAARWETDPRDTAQPEAMTALLARLHRGELLSKESTARLLDMMRRCKTGGARLRALLPKGTPVFNKTGTTGNASNDVGIVTLPDGSHLAIAVYVTSSRKQPARERTIAEIARAAYEAFSAHSAPAARKPA